MKHIKSTLVLISIFFLLFGCKGGKLPGSDARKIPYDPKERVKRNLEHMKKELPRDKLLRDRADFSKFFNEHDARRGTDFLATFPEMSQFYFMCEEAEALQ